MEGEGDGIGVGWGGDRGRGERKRNMEGLFAWRVSWRWGAHGQDEQIPPCVNTHLKLVSSPKRHSSLVIHKIDPNASAARETPQQARKVTIPNRAILTPTASQSRQPDQCDSLPGEGGGGRGYGAWGCGGAGGGGGGGVKGVELHTK